MKQYAGHDGLNNEWLVTIHDAEGSKPERAEVTWRGDEWETFSAPVMLDRIAS